MKKSTGIAILSIVFFAGLSITSSAMRQADWTAKRALFHKDLAATAAGRVEALFELKRGMLVKQDKFRRPSSQTLVFERTWEVLDLNGRKAGELEILTSSDRVSARDISAHLKLSQTSNLSSRLLKHYLASESYKPMAAVGFENTYKAEGDSDKASAHIVLKGLTP